MKIQRKQKYVLIRAKTDIIYCRKITIDNNTNGPICLGDFFVLLFVFGGFFGNIFHACML